MSAIARRRGQRLRRPTRPFLGIPPYRGSFNPPYNAAAKLAIPTPNGLGAMHPDVIDMGAAWHGYRYWMAMTPYNGDEQTEIPSIVASTSLAAGGTWVAPTGFINPITADQAGTTHMADTDLVYDAATDRIYVFYVVTDASTFYDIRSKWTSGDGTWSAETTVLTGAGSSNMTNPSVIKTSSGWRIYYTQGGFTAASKLMYYRDSTGAPDAGYGVEVATTLSLGESTRMNQNLNMIKDVDGSYVALISDSNENTLEGRLVFARSVDGGTTFRLTGPPVLEKGPVGNWDAGGIYRASILVDTNGVVVPNGSNVHLWYSGYQAVPATVWGTGYAPIPLQLIRP